MDENIILLKDRILPGTINGRDPKVSGQCAGVFIRPDSLSQKFKFFITGLRPLYGRLESLYSIPRSIDQTAI
jgi:hypothetical protein